MTGRLRSSYRRVRRAVNCALGRDLRFRVELPRPVVRHGSDYGGWWVDPAGLGAGSLVYSIGVGTDITFDLSLIAAYDVTVHAFDPTPASRVFLEQQTLPANFSWHPVGVASYDGRATFHPPADPGHVSHSMVSASGGSRPPVEVDVRRLTSLMASLGHSSVDLLKMDIEGAEYDVLADILASGVEIPQILVEFHHRMPGIGIARTREAVARLHASGYRISAVSDTGEELSFVRAS